MAPDLGGLCMRGIYAIIHSMLTLLIAIAAGCGGYCAAFYAGDWGVGWSVTAGVVAFGVTQGVIGFLVQKRIKADMERVQGILLEGQKRLQTKMQRWQFRPPGSQKDAQREIENDSRIFVREALAATECLSKYRWMVPMIGRQKATAQLQLNWMIKDFKAVDELLPKALFIDPTTSAIKIARMYMKDASVEEMEKVYRKSVRRLKYNQNVLLAADPFAQRIENAARPENLRFENRPAAVRRAPRLDLSVQIVAVDGNVIDTPSAQRGDDALEHRHSPHRQKRFRRGACERPEPRAETRRQNHRLFRRRHSL